MPWGKQSNRAARFERELKRRGDLWEAAVQAAKLLMIRISNLAYIEGFNVLEC